MEMELSVKVLQKCNHFIGTIINAIPIIKHKNKLKILSNVTFPSLFFRRY